MNLFAIQYAIKSITRRKRKNFITSLAIALGVALFIGAQSAGNGVVQTVVEGNLNLIGETDITISNPASPDGFFPQNITDEIMSSSDLRIQDNVLSMAPVIQFTTSVYSEGLIEADIIMNGIRQDDTKFGNFIDYETGEIINLNTELRGLGASDVLVSNTLAEDLDLNVNEPITFSFTQGNGSFTSVNMVVSAIYDDLKGRGLDGIGLGEVTGQLYVNLEVIQNELASEFRGCINQVNIIIKNVDRDIDAFDADGKTFPGKSKIEDTMEALEGLFHADGIDTDGNAPLILSSRVNLANTVLYEEIIFIVKALLPVFAVMLNGTALLLIVNIQIMAVEDRKKQTAVLRALGSTIMTIFVVFLIEATIVGVIGALLGLGLGYLVSLWMLAMVSDVFGVTSSGSSVELGLAIISIIIGVLLSVITAVLPSMNAARSSVSNALRGIEEEKPKRKGSITLIFGMGLAVIGFAFASNIGDFWKKEAWNTYEKQGSILLGLGLTLAGLALLLTIILPRRFAFSISGIVLWGLGLFTMGVSSSWAKSGDPATWFPIMLIYTVAGSTILVAQNYDAIMNWLMKGLFLVAGLRAIGQVTTQQMIGKKSRGILVYTILSIILFLSIFFTSAAETQRVNSTTFYDPMSFGVDVQVTVTSPIAGIHDRLLSLEDRESSLGLGNLPTIERVFSFRRAFIPMFIDSPVDPFNSSKPNQDFDVTQDLVFIPVIEIPQAILNPSGTWGDNSLPFRFRVLSDRVKQEVDVNPNVKDSLETHLNTSKTILDMFYDPIRNIREQEITINNQKTIESQRMAIGSALMLIPPTSPIQDLALKGIDGFNFYLQDRDGVPIPMYIGATTNLDMLGLSKLMGYGLLVSEDIANQLPQFEDLVNPNLFLVKTSNSFQLKGNDILANAIEKDLNDLSNPNSFSSTEGQLVGATSRIIYEEIEGFLFYEAASWDFFAVFTSLGLVIGALGMMIIAVRSVSERTREIGMMRSIGFSQRSIVIGVVIELLALSLLGLILGITNAVIFTESFANSDLGVNTVYPVATLIYYIGGVIGLGIIAGIIPGYAASKIAPSQAMRYTG